MKNKKFLVALAENVSQMPQEDIQKLRLIFTNRRAIKYFLKEYRSIKQGVYFLPQCDTISDFVQQHSQLKIADELSLIYVLYNCYQQVWYSHNPLGKGEEKETFEQFYFWGKTILSDFDDIDKNLADASKLYITLSEEKEIEDKFDFLDQNQKEILSQYFADFKKLYSAQSSLQRNFTKIWNCLFEVYELYRKALAEHSLAYSGMIYRDLVERLQQGSESFGDDMFAFVGFNVLNQSEKALFTHIKNNNKALFFWDYDTFYTQSSSNEAGLFMRENIKAFAHDETFSQNDFSAIENNDCRLKIVSSTYSTEQTNYIRSWISNLEKEYGKSLQQSDMAIILNDENLLPFVLKSLPKTINNCQTKVNITMGYPFKFGKLYEQIADFLSQAGESDKTIKQQLGELTQFLIDTAQQPECEPKDKQACFSSIKTIEQFEQTLDFIDSELPANFVSKILLRLLKKRTMPFESDATDGIQIMGLLESRSLDFDHILMLSTGSSNLPKVSNTITFIPHSLRVCFNLTTDEKKTAVFAYYFYRLLHHAKTIDYVYSMVLSNKDAEEMSCFLQQLRVELQKPIKLLKLPRGENINRTTITLPPKDEQTIEQLLSGRREGDEKSSYFSASLLNSYISCPLSFYYERILKLKISEADEDYTYRALGNLFHQAAQIFEESNKSKSIETCIEESYDLLKDEEKSIMVQFHKDIAASFLKDLEIYDNKKPERCFVAAEREVVKTIEIDGQLFRFGGKIDRIDKEGDKLILCDYKTGGSPEKLQEIEKLFDPNNKNRAKYLFQIMFYAWLEWDGKPIDVEVIYLHKLKSSHYEVKSYTYNAILHEEFDQKMRELIASMLSTEKTIWETLGNDNVCQYCNYKDLCSKDIDTENDD